MINIFKLNCFLIEPLMRVELMTPSLPRMYSTTELQRLFASKTKNDSFHLFERAKIHYFFNLPHLLIKKIFIAVIY